MISLVEIFKNAEAAAKVAADAKNGKASAYDGMLDGVAAHFAGSEFDATKAGDAIAKAWEKARGEKIPGPTKSEMLIAAQAGASGIYDAAAKAWDGWVAHCAGEKRATGSRYQTVRDLLRYSLAGGVTSDDGSKITFDLDAGGIYDMKEFRAAAKAKPSVEALLSNVEDLASMCGGNVTVDMTVTDIITTVKRIFPKAFETKKAAKKEKSRPSVVVTVVPAPANTPATIQPVNNGPVETTESVAPMDFSVVNHAEILKMLASGDKKTRAEGQKRLAALRLTP